MVLFVYNISHLTLYLVFHVLENTITDLYSFHLTFILYFDFFPLPLIPLASLHSSPSPSSPLVTSRRAPALITCPAQAAAPRERGPGVWWPLRRVLEGRGSH